MLSGLLPSNQAHVEHAVDMVLARGRRNVGMLGLSFKTGTDDLRESPLVTIAERFIGKGLKLRIYDPDVNLSRLIGANRRYIEQSIPHIGDLMSDNLEETVKGADIVIVGLGGKALHDSLKNLTRDDQLVLDLVRIADREGLRGRYKGVCW